MKLLIAIPSLDYMHAEFVRSLVNLTARLSDEGIEHRVEIKTGTLVYVARDLLVNKALEDGYTHVLWFDADMIFTDDILDDLMWSGKDFVCAVYHARRPPHMSSIFTEIEPEYKHVHEYPTDTFEIAGCGFGCVLMSIDILKAVKTKYNTAFCPTQELGEDLAFCQRVTACGFKMYCEPSARCGHIGHITIWPEDEDTWRSKLK